VELIQILHLVPTSNNRHYELKEARKSLYGNRRIMRVDIKLIAPKNPYRKVARQNRARRLKGTEENIKSYPIVNDSYV